MDIKKIISLEPSIIICEYNSLFGQKKQSLCHIRIIILDQTVYFSNLFYGASIKAFMDLLKKEIIFLLVIIGKKQCFFKKIFGKRLINL